MSQGASGTSSAPNGSGQAFITLEKAVLQLIQNSDKDPKSKGFSILKHRISFRKKILCFNYSSDEHEKRENLIQAVNRGLGRVLVRAEKKGWPEDYTRQKLIRHEKRRRMKGYDSKELKACYSFLLKLLKKFRSLGNSPEIRRPWPEEVWRIIRLPDGALWKLGKETLTLIVAVLLCLITAASTVSGALINASIVKKAETKTEMQSSGGEALNDKNIVEKLTSISQQLEELIGLVKPAIPVVVPHTAEDGSESERAAISITGFLENIVLFIREFFTGLLPDFLISPGEGSTFRDRVKDWQSGARDWLSNLATELANGLVGIWNWLMASIQSVIGQATGQPSGSTTG